MRRRQQHAERLVREPALERIGHEVVPPAAREGLDQHGVARRQDRLRALQVQPVLDLRRAGRPVARVGQHARAPARPDRSRAGTCRPHRRGSWACRSTTRLHERLVVDDGLQGQDLAAEQEGVAAAAASRGSRPRSRPAPVRRAPIGPVRRSRRRVAAAPRTSRTFSMVASTMVPTFMPVLLGDPAVGDAPAARPGSGGSWRSARRPAARSRRARRNRARASNSSRVSPA